jgi:hypothetical protein
MRTDLTSMALADASNRYQLTKSVAKVTRMLHRPNTRVQDTMNEAFKWLGRFKPGAARASTTPPRSSAPRAPYRSGPITHFAKRVMRFGPSWRPAPIITPNLFPLRSGQSLVCKVRRKL